MKKKITFLMLMIFATANIFSQNYTISFDASGAATTLDSVKIINLTHPDTAMWHNGDIFQLQLNNAINEIETNKENLLIFPNPMQGKAEIMFNVKQTGIASIKIYEITGKEIIHSDENLSQGNHQFQLSGLKQGAYFINIRGNGYFYSSKLISYNSFSNDINLKYNGVIHETNTNKYKTTSSSINFNFVSGDMLQFTGYAANLTDVFTYSPTSDITITFSFITSIPGVTTDAATSITTNSAICGGNVTSDGGEIVTARGICYATTANPTIANIIVASGSGTGLFTANLTGLTSSTTYYIRAYATNSIGTAYGNEVSFTTTTIPIIIVTDYDGNIYDTVHIGTQIWMKQNLKTTHYKNGALINYPGTNNAAWQNTTSGAYAWYNNNETSYKHTFGALYNWYAVNTGNLCPSGWHVPTDAEWSTLTIYLGGDSIAGGKLKATVLWSSPNTGATNETGFSALPGGYRNNDGAYNSLGYYGYWWSSSEYNTTNVWYSTLTYNFNIAGSGNANKVRGFSVRCLKDLGNQANLPTITTTSVTAITATTVTSGGSITSDGGAAVTARGVCWSNSANPTIALITKTTDGNGIGNFTSNITSLAPNTTYYIRAYAINSAGTAYGNEVSFTTALPPIGTVIDFDGNVYDTVHIGTQIWMKQNLKTTQYKNGVAIDYPGTNNTTWQFNNTGAYAWYNNDSINYKNIYGGLYNWYAVNTGNLCPVGWHVPTDAEWTTLTTYLGGEAIAGTQLKATTLWTGPGTGATNSSGFTAIPGGYRSIYGIYNHIGHEGCWWSSTEYNSGFAYLRHLFYNGYFVGRENDFKTMGYSVRCIKN